jgi:excinuclease UvrABC ATPase subunit
MARPDVDVLDGLTTAILVDQQRMGADARSTVGTATDANAMLRIVFSRLGKPQIGSPNAFSFDVRGVDPADSEVDARQGQGGDAAPHPGVCRPEKSGIYVLDEPTTGLHLADVEQLLGLLDRLVDSGKSVIVIEHHQAVMAHADWIIDLGPGAGHDGGQIVFEGTPAELVAARSTLTGEHLAAYVGA